MLVSHGPELRQTGDGEGSRSRRNFQVKAVMGTQTVHEGANDSRNYCVGAVMDSSEGTHKLETSSAEGNTEVGSNSSEWIMAWLALLATLSQTSMRKQRCEHGPVRIAYNSDFVSPIESPVGLIALVISECTGTKCLVHYPKVCECKRDGSYAKGERSPAPKRRL